MSMTFEKLPYGLNAQKNRIKWAPKSFTQFVFL